MLSTLILYLLLLMNNAYKLAFCKKMANNHCTRVYYIYGVSDKKRQISLLTCKHRNYKAKIRQTNIVTTLYRYTTDYSCEK